MDAVTLHHGDALDVLRGMADASVDAVVTDPPAGIAFMGKTWDHDHGGRDGWVAAFAAIFAEALRVTKPGGHALVWALPRTSHWTACALEDAGWEIRDCVAHLFGSGFPKSLDVGKAIDKAAGVEREVVGEGPFASRRPRADHDKQGLTFADDGYIRPPGHTLSAPATDAARQWDGWGTALKPAIEFWWLARKPLVGTVAANVQAWGTGALHIEACRVGTEDTRRHNTGGEYLPPSGYRTVRDLGAVTGSPAGRWPPNVALSHAPGCQRVGTRRVRGGNGVRGSDAGNTMYGGGKGMNRPTTGQTVGYADADGLETVDNFACVDGCPVKALAEQSGERKDGTYHEGVARLQRGFRDGQQGISKQYGEANAPDNYGDTGTAARFFPNFEPSPLDDLDAPWLYTAKASRREREAGLEGMVRLRQNLTDEQRAYVLTELEAAGVRL